MHYSSPTIDQKNSLNKCQIVPKKPLVCNNIKGNPVRLLGQRFGLSKLDKETIRRRYNCPGLFLKFKLVY